MAEVVCIGQNRPCVLRVTRLDNECVPLDGPTDAIVVAAISDITLTPEFRDATYLEPEDACGNVVYVAETPKRLKRYTMAGNLVVIGFEGRELLTDAALLIGAVSSDWSGDAVGVAAPGLQDEVKAGVFIEVWVQATAAGSTGPCGPDGENPKWVRHVLPRALLSEDAVTYNGEATNFSFSGSVTANPFADDPYGDMPLTAVPLTSPHYQFYDTLPPEVVCGYVGGS